MKTETIELLKLIDETKDKEKAILKAFAIMLDYLMPQEPHGSSPKASDESRPIVNQKYPPS